MDHHVVSKFYLRGFRDPAVSPKQGPRLWVGDVRRGSAWLRSPRAVATRENYYAVRREDGSIDPTAEEILSRVETVVAPIIKRIRKGQCNLTDQERAQLAFHMALGVTRVPGWRGSIQERAGALAQQVMLLAAERPDYFTRIVREANAATQPMTEEEIEDLRQWALDPSNYTIEGTPELSLKLMLRVANRSAAVVYDMPWMFLTPPDGRQFVSGDNPIHWIDPTAPPAIARGLAHENAVLTFPLGPEVCLVGAWRDVPVSKVAPEEIIDNINLRPIRYADRCIFAASEQECRRALLLRKEVEARGLTVGQPPLNIVVQREGKPVPSIQG